MSLPKRSGIVRFLRHCHPTLTYRQFYEEVILLLHNCCVTIDPAK